MFPLGKWALNVFPPPTVTIGRLFWPSSCSNPKLYIRLNNETSSKGQMQYIGLCNRYTYSTRVTIYSIDRICRFSGRLKIAVFEAVRA
jgi:hypothetical protein